ncbi:MAG TPA: NADH-quinone oxidoreductase subunit NuoK [Desulfobacteria bacterium]|nr:NADH-quinone oxidoreductase subunit NuoK [Desulfobacteria bacterium]
MSLTVGLPHYLLVGAMLFCFGLYGMFSKRNAIAVLMSLELMLNAVNVNLVAFNRFLFNQQMDFNGIKHYLLSGQVSAIFVIVVAAAEVAVGLALVITIYRNRLSTNVDELDWLKW